MRKGDGAAACWNISFRLICSKLLFQEDYLVLAKLRSVHVMPKEVTQKLPSSPNVQKGQLWLFELQPHLKTIALHFCFFSCPTLTLHMWKLRLTESNYLAQNGIQC